MSTPVHEKSAGVSSTELFFDLVFVFVITQVTQLVEHAHGPVDFLRALLVLVPIWWMYAGYAWLTNNVRVTWQMRLVLIAAMAGFLTMAQPLGRHPEPRRIERGSCGPRIRRHPQGRGGMFRDARAATVSLLSAS